MRASATPGAVSPHVAPLMRATTLSADCHLLHHRSVDDVLHLLAIVLSKLARCRRSHHNDKALLRVAEELRAVGAIPGELAGIARHRGQAFAGAHGDAEAE